MWNPEEDGITHINVYSKGKTSLGRFASNFAKSPILTADGSFASIEGYWYWLGSDSAMKDMLRDTYGYAAKQMGRDLRGTVKDPDFEEKVKLAITTKFLMYPEHLNELCRTDLPLAHYYVAQDKAIEPEGCEWVIEHIDSLRHRDLWWYHDNMYWAVITTNTCVNMDGKAAMGAGLAKQAASKFPGLAKEYGKRLEAGDRHLLKVQERLILVPTKENWRNPSTIELVEKAVRALRTLPTGVDKVVVPPLGCGFGGLKYSDVRPILDQLPVDRFLLLSPGSDTSEKWSKT